MESTKAARADGQVTSIWSKVSFASAPGGRCSSTRVRRRGGVKVAAGLIPKLKKAS